MLDFQEQFYKDSYCTHFTSKVISCTLEKDTYAILLEDTIFYPEGGGQPSDVGTLNGIEVVDVQRVKDKVVHYTKDPIPVGTVVEEVIDWDVRFDLMQAHSGEHMFSGLVHKQFGYDNVGFHMSDRIQVDFNGSFTWEEARKLEKECNEAIYQNIPIHTSIYKQEEIMHLEYRSKKELEGNIRIIQIGEVDTCACCGTHVKATGEVGCMKVISLKKYKQGVRLELLFGRKAFEFYQKVFEENESISHMLSTPLTETSNGVKKMIDQKEILEANLIDAYKRSFLKELEQTSSCDKYLYIVSGVSRELMRYYAKELVKKMDLVCVVEEEGDHLAYLLMSNDTDVKEIDAHLKQHIEGKGGGSKELVQGTLFTTLETLKKIWEDL